MAGVRPPELVPKFGALPRVIYVYIELGMIPQSLNDFLIGGTPSVTTKTNQIKESY